MSQADRDDATASDGAQWVEQGRDAKNLKSWCVFHLRSQWLSWTCVPANITSPLVVGPLVGLPTPKRCHAAVRTGVLPTCPSGQQQPWWLLPPALAPLPTMHLHQVTLTVGSLNLHASAVDAQR